MQWLNEPAAWREEDGRIAVTARGRTDFWRRTHNDEIRDDGHFYHRPVTGDFTILIEVAGRYRDQYDQAGIMIRVSETTWLKCGIELVGGVQQASVVCTREYSDWSVLPLGEPQAPGPPAVWFRAEYLGGMVEVSYSLAGDAFSMLRRAWLAPPDEHGLTAGIMIASPRGPGFEAVFRHLEIRPSSHAV